MSQNIATASPDLNLEQEAAIIQRECAAADAAGHCRIDHGIEAGNHLINVKQCIGRGLRGWLAKHDLKKTQCYDFMLLALNAESVRRAGHSSIAAALRTLRAKSGGSTSALPSQTNPPDRLSRRQPG